jgi:hypothetical protein
MFTIMDHIWNFDRTLAELHVSEPLISNVNWTRAGQWMTAFKEVCGALQDVVSAYTLASPGYGHILHSVKYRSCHRSLKRGTSCPLWLKHFPSPPSTPISHCHPLRPSIRLGVTFLAIP